MVAVSLGVAVLLGVTEGVWLELGVALGVTVKVGVAVTVEVGVTVRVLLGVTVAVGVVVVVPVTVSVPVFVTAPVAVTDKLLFAVMVFKITAPVAFTVTLFPVKLIAAVKVLPAWFNDRSFVPALTVVVLLDGGLPSPLLFLILLPVTYAGLVFRPIAAAACGVISLAELLIIATTDSVTTPQGDRLLIVASVTVGLGVLTWLSSVQRARLDRRFAALTHDLEVLAATDHLTGCLNHRAFSDRVEDEIDRAVRHGQPLSLVVADVDDFKRVNDTYGHPAGDDALERAGAALRTRSRRSDIVGRIGGDEFALLLPGVALDAAAVFSQRVFDAFETGIGRLTFSAGVASLELTKPTADHLFHQADQSMYVVKRNGGDGVAVTSPFGEPTQLRGHLAPGIA